MSASIRIDVEDARHAVTAMLAYLCEDPESGPLCRLRRALERHDRYNSKPRPKRQKRVRGRGCGICEKCLQGDMRHCPTWGEPRGVRASKSERREETTAIREACLKRAQSYCECGCRRPLAVGLESIPELDHVFSKGKGARLPQSVETCWILRADCHRERTANRPDAETWWRKFLAHVSRHYDGGKAWVRVSHAASMRLAFVEVRRSLPAAPRV